MKQPQRRRPLSFLPLYDANGVLCGALGRTDSLTLEEFEAGVRALFGDQFGKAGEPLKAERGWWRWVPVGRDGQVGLDAAAGPACGAFEAWVVLPEQEAT